jgi:hypothetical protein
MSWLRSKTSRSLLALGLTLGTLTATTVVVPQAARAESLCAWQTVGYAYYNGTWYVIQQWICIRYF